MTRVLVVDDHPVFRRGLRALLEASGIDVIGEAGKGADAAHLARQSAPDVVLMDLGLPDMSGADAVRQIIADRPGTPVLVISLYQDDGSVERAIRAGARGYVVKDAPAQEVVAAVHAVASGAAVLGGSLTARFTDLVRTPREVDAEEFPGLTSRERQVLALLTSGLTNAAIAERLGLSAKTVANYVSVVLAKIDAADRADARAKVSSVSVSADGKPGDPVR